MLRYISIGLVGGGGSVEVVVGVYLLLCMSVSILFAFFIIPAIISTININVVVRQTDICVCMGITIDISMGAL